MNSGFIADNARECEGQNNYVIKLDVQNDRLHESSGACYKGNLG